MMLAHRKTKIVATIGPASESEAGLKNCLMAGMNVARLNFSHGDHAQHLKVINALHKLSEELKAPVAILQDLQGPKIRVGKIKSIDIKKGEQVTVVGEGEAVAKGTSGKVIPIDIKNLHQIVKVGTAILIEDGLMELKVLKVSKNQIICDVIHGGTVKERKGVNLPNVSLPMSSLTDKDLADLKFGLENNVDYVALSFVRQAKDIVELRKLIKKSGKTARIVAKIEMAEAIENLAEIIEVSDAVMVARGDLAVEVGQTRLASLQKRIIHLCNEIGRPVITATQMLESMKENPRPTRAEITDVANAVLDGSDALMLSAESASGKYPTESIATMHDLICEVEKEDSIYNKISLESRIQHIPEAISVSASLCSMTLDAKVIVCLSTTGRTARLISRFRPKAHLLAATDEVHTLRSLELCWGVQTMPITNFQMNEDLMSEIEALLVSHNLVKTGDQVVITLGLPIQKGNKTNALRVFTVGAKPKTSKPVPKPLRYQVFPF
jgi:pyruvate kinase